jgi:hypothetical protein
MNDQVGFILIVIIAVLVFIYFIYNKINKAQKDEAEHEKKVADLKNLRQIEKEKNASELKILINKARQDKADRERLRVDHEKEIVNFKRLLQIEKEKIEAQLKVLNDLVKQYELCGELNISIADRDISRKLYAEEGEYANKLLEIEKADFFSIYNISQRHMQSLQRSNILDANTLFEKVKGGLDILTTNDELHQYKFAFDQKHNAKLQSAFSEFILKIGELDIPLIGNLDIIDWGCGQALASFLFLDYLLSSGIDNLFINKIILVEPSEVAIKRGVAIIDRRVKGTSLHPLIKVVNKKLDAVEVSDICTHNANAKLHLFSNILDVPNLDIQQIVSIISRSQRNKNYFICVSPNINGERNARLDSFFQLFQNENKTVIISKRTNNIQFTLFSGTPSIAERYEIMFFSNIVSSDMDESVERFEQESIPISITFDPVTVEKFITDNFGTSGKTVLLRQDVIKNYGGTEYKSTRTMLMKNIPENKSIADVNSAIPKTAKIQQTISHEPIITENMQSAIDQDLTTVENVKKSQLLQSIDENTGAMLPVLDKINGKKQYRLMKFDKNGTAVDIDLRTYTAAEELAAKRKSVVGQEEV